MQSIARDSRLAPGLEMIAENHNLRRATDRLTHEREIIVNAWGAAADESAQWERLYNQECEATRRLSAEIATLKADNLRLKHIAERKGCAAYKKEGWWKRCRRRLGIRQDDEK